MFEHPEYMFVGAGEGNFLRFHPRKLEIHSSAATLLFSYGIVGIALFLVFLRLLSVTAGPRLTLLMIPVLSYSLFHQGMRARPFWLFLAVALGVGVLNAIEIIKAPKEPALSLAER